MQRLEAALATPRTLAIPLLTSSLTTVAAFMPLVLIEGGSGEFLSSLGQVLALALLILVADRDHCHPGVLLLVPERLGTGEQADARPRTQPRNDVAAVPLYRRVPGVVPA